MLSVAIRNGIPFARTNDRPQGKLRPATATRATNAATITTISRRIDRRKIATGNNPMTGSAKAQRGENIRTVASHQDSAQDSMAQTKRTRAR